MRIMHVSEAHATGVLGLIRQFTLQQQRQGDDVHVLAPSSLGLTKGVNEHHWRLSRNRPIGWVLATLRLGRLVRSLDPDVIHLHSFIAGFVGRLPIVVPRGIPIVYQPHSWSFDLFTGIKRRAVVAWEKLAGRRTRILVANCQDEIAEGRRVGIRLSSRALGIAVDTDFFCPPSEQARLDAKREVGFVERSVILVLARLSYQKGQDMLVPAWESAPIPDTDLVLVGPGTGSDYETLAPTQWNRTVHWMGESEDVRKWLWASDVLALPSRYEGESVVVGEAMATGLPVVATAVNGTRGAILDGPLPPCGSVVSIGDMEALLSACRTRLEDTDLRATESRNARNRAEASFQPTVVVRRLSDAYGDAIHATGQVEEG